MLPKDTEMNIKYHGGLTVSSEMKRILSQEGFLNHEKGGQRLRGLYVDESANFNPNYLSDFAKLCFFGFLDQVQTEVEAGSAPDLTGTETAYHFGYATIVISGSKQIVRSSNTDSSQLKHAETLKYLLAKGCPADVPDVTGHTALHHVVTSPSAAPELDVDYARILLTDGQANVDAQNRYGEIPIFLAMQRKYIEAVELLMEFGTRMDIKEADGISPDPFYIQCGPRVTAAVCKWLAKRRNDAERLRAEKKCEQCGSSGDDTGISLKECSRCKVARYCSKTCQVKHWSTHKPACRPFDESTTITIKPYYLAGGHMFSTSEIMRRVLDINTHPSPSSSKSSKASKPFQPSSAVPSNMSPKSLTIKVQVTYNPMIGRVGGEGPMVVYTRKRDFTCHIRKQDNVEAYNKLSHVVKERGVGGLKAYFAAELKNKDELVIKVADVLAEQPF